MTRPGRHRFHRAKWSTASSTRGAEVAVSVVNATNVVAFAWAADLGLTGAETIAAIGDAARWPG